MSIKLGMSRQDEARGRNSEQLKPGVLRAGLRLLIHSKMHAHAFFLTQNGCKSNPEGWFLLEDIYTARVRNQKLELSRTMN